MDGAINNPEEDFTDVEAILNLLPEIKADFNTTKANAFVKAYLTGKDNAVYKSATRENYAQILAEHDVWNNMTAEEQAAVNALLAPKIYPDYLKAAEAIKAQIEKERLEREAAERLAKQLFEEPINKFIKNWLTGIDGQFYTDVTVDNYTQILNGKADWEKLTQEQKNVINAKLYPQSYESMLRKAESIWNLYFDTPYGATAPQTGDSNPITLWILLICMSGAAAVLVSKKVRKSR